MPYGAPNHGPNKNQSQKPNARPSNVGRQANSVWQGLWGNGLRQQHNWSERHECYVRDDAQQHCTCACGKETFTYGNPVIDYRLQKEFQHWICITARGNLITYESSASVHTADLDTAKLHWNSDISTALARYMCLYIKNFYLMGTCK